MHVAKKYNGEIINVDSAQVYKGMDIGTAKLSANERQLVPQHLLDIRDPFSSYSAADFVTDATQAIEAIHARNKLPILAGGTMLYFKALFEGMADLPAADPDYRKILEKRAAQLGWPALHMELAQVDEQSALRIKPSDKQRIQRALEVYQLSGETLSTWHARQSSINTAHEFLKIALVPVERSLLHQKIEKRLHQMMEQGFIDELKGLIKRSEFNRQAPALRAVGYRQLLEHILDHESLDESVQKAIYASRQLAKRQLTWLRKWSDLNILRPFDKEVVTNMEQLLNEFLLH